MDTIISLTILPSRIDSAQDCINSLLNQKGKWDFIQVWIPRNCRRDKKEVNEIPSYLINDKIKIGFTDDMGPITKIYPTLQKYFDNKELNIITADDDVIYPDNWVKNLVKFSNKNPNNVICYRGRNFQDKRILKYMYTTLITCNSIEQMTKVSIVTGTWGALYKPKFFTEEFFDVDLDTPFFYVDDIWISGQLLKNNIDAYVIPNYKPIIPTKNADNLSLWEINRKGNNNDYGINYFKEEFQK
jgi:hypothetical protein